MSRFNKNQLIESLKMFNNHENASMVSRRRCRDDRKHGMDNSEIDKFQTIFKRPKRSILTRTNVNVEGWIGVAYSEEMTELIKIFATFDPINDLSQHTETYVYRTHDNNNDVERQTLVHLDRIKTTKDERGSIIVSYLQHENFNVDLLKSRKWCFVVHAIFTYLLSSSLNTLLWIKIMYPEFASLMTMLYDAKLNANKSLFVVSHETFDWIYTRAPFRFLYKHFVPTSSNKSTKIPFSLLNYLELSFVDELENFYKKLNDNSIDEKFTEFLEKPKPIPYDIEHIIGKYDTILGKSNIRYFTGQACCGKTTLVQQLNFEAKSRGCIGGFSEKADSLASVSCLHFSIDFALRQFENTIGVSVWTNCDDEMLFTIGIMLFYLHRIVETSIILFGYG